MSETQDVDIGKTILFNMTDQTILPLNRPEIPDLTLISNYDALNRKDG
jgi:hypothetical protein